MNPEEIRARLSGAAESAGPPELDTALLVRRVRRGRLARRALTGGAALVLAAAAVLGAVRWSGPGGGEADAAGSPDGPYACGRRLPSGGPATAANGITLSILSVRGAGDGSGPEITVGLGADRAFQATGAPPEYLEVLYLRDGVVVGGGPLLKRPGDRYEQGTDAVGYTYRLSPGAPLAVPLGPRDGLCPSVTWPRVWSEPGRYEVVVLVNPPVELGAPPPSGPPQPWLVARAPLPG
ncbi:hypothetical protein [Kitasatospora sp. NPDC057198]|uniref:hypothetical protein n=1 Tax=Kitasatospora sp. NPDC057198 TaxID=3346046 RepID=UPI003636A491